VPSTVEQLSPTRAKLTIEMPFDELTPSIDKAYKEIASQVNIPGFRKGKVPAALIDQRFGRGVVLQEAINDALPEAYGKAVEEHKLNPLGQPDVEVTQLEDGDKVEFTAEVDVRPEFDLPDVSDVSVTVDALEVSEDEIQERVDMLRQRFASTNDVARPAADGDLITIDLEGSQNGEVLEDATAADINYKVGAGNMLEGLDEAVIGLSAGEFAEFEADLLGGAHQGEKSTIKVTVTKVSEQELPEVDDEFAQLVSQFDTVEEMRDDLKQSLLQMARLNQAADARDKVLEAVIQQLDFELPESLVSSELEARKQQVTQQLGQAGLSVEQYLKDAEDETAETEDEFWADIEKRSLDALRAQIVLDKVADDEQVSVEQQELTEMIFRKAKQNGSTPEDEAKHMMEHNHLPEWMQEIRRSKALAGIVSRATVQDANGEAIDLDNLQSDGSYAADESDEDAPGDN